LTAPANDLARRAVLAVAIGLAFALVGCHSRREQQGCRMETEVVLFSSRASPAAVSVTRGPRGGYLAAWSADGETWIAGIEHKALRLAWTRRVDRYPTPVVDRAADEGPKTFWPEGGLASPNAEDLVAVATAGGGLALAMLERPSGPLTGGAYVALLGPQSSSPVTVVRIGPAGPFASRIAAAVNGGELLVAWHEGHPDVSRVRLAVVDSARARLLGDGSVPGKLAQSGPAIAAGPSGAVLAWTRTVHRDGVPLSEVRAASLGDDLTVGPATTVASGRYLDPAPHLVSIGDRFGIALRDDADDDDKPEFYFALLDNRGRVTKGPQRISRADGFQGPYLAVGEPLVFSAAIRSFQRNYLIGLNRFDLAGVKRGGEFQVYADKSDFIRVALLAHDRSVVLVYGEDRRGSGRVLASRVVCREGAGASP
jgi:hypothetical protein